MAEKDDVGSPPDYTTHGIGPQELPRVITVGARLINPSRPAGRIKVT